jgi:hypothetical protein
MIPSDLAARLRLLTESLVNPLAPVRGISPDLPELPVGQRFTARIESVLPDGTFRALVAGRSLTLSLPQQARAGETLELVVAERQPQLIVARQAGESTPPQSPPTLSRAGQLISALLAGEEATPRPPVLSGSAPLLPAPPQQAARLAPALQQAVVESGLFYESHQAQWIAGRYPVEALLREPQAHHNRPPRPVAEGTPSAKPASAPATPPAVEPTVMEASPSRSAPAAAAPGLPAELQPLVQQQLDAAATQHIVWRGELWPGQTLHWEVEREDTAGRQTSEAEEAAWTTALRLELPRLGEIKAVLRLSGERVSLAMTAQADHVGTLRQGLDELVAAFAAAGLNPLAAQVDSHERI